MLNVIPCLLVVFLTLLLILKTTCTFALSTMTPLTINVIPEEKLFVSEPNPVHFGNGANDEFNPEWTNENWLKSRFHFSFAEYHNPSNNNFGVMRVMNDDLVQPKRGFGTHPHRNMEIITYIVHGQLTHQDSMGSEESLGRGSIQFMTAGTGVRHSEFNDGEKPLRFIQTWIIPRTNSLEPNYGSYNAAQDCEAKKNQVQYLASDVDDDAHMTPVKVNQDVDCHAGEIELNESVSIDLKEGRQAYLLAVEGTLEVNGKTLTKYDACEIFLPAVGGDDDGEGGGKKITIKAKEVESTENGDVAHFLMFSMKNVSGSGRKDIL